MAKRREVKRLKESENVPALLDEISKAPQQHAAYLNYMLEAHIAFHNYFQKLEPYVSIVIDEPQGDKKYTRAVSKLPNIPLTPEDCNRHFPKRDYANNSTQIIYPSMVIPADNKGYWTSEILTTFLALSPSEISPLPWSEPDCSPYLEETISDSMELFPNLTLQSFNDSDFLKFEEPSLKAYLTSIYGTSNQKAIIGDISQRVATCLRYQIGPKWIAGNLAATYWRYRGKSKAAATCIKLALTDAKFQDLSLVQLAQLTMRLGPDYFGQTKAILQKALEIDPTEPVSYYLLGYLNFLMGSPFSAKQALLKALAIEPELEEAQKLLTEIRCLNRQPTFVSIKNLIPGVCCWPAEQNAYCYGKGKTKKCFKMAIRGDQVGFEYVRCSGKYTKKSYPPPGTFQFLAPYFISQNEIQTLRIQHQYKRVTVIEEKPDNRPVIPLDYGGFDPDSYQIPEDDIFNEDDHEQGMIDFGKIREDRLRQEVENEELLKAKMSEQEFKAKILLIEEMTERKQVMALDADLPSYLPEPSDELIAKGLRYLNPPKANTLADYCVMTEKNKRVLDHPSPTYISVTAKGVRLEDYVDLSAPVTTITKDEPICPEVELTDEWKIIDDLPAFRFKEFFKFYKPELALTDALMSLGHKHERIDHVAARLHLAMKTSKLNPKHGHLQDDGVNGVITAASTLYWRVKGDAVNALKCLRHALKNLPKDKKDTSLIGLANIFHQAGFLHSALIAGGKAHQLTDDLVVTHFTLANIYASMGDNHRALKFFYSTLALQPSFQQAKERIRAIYCLTRGQVRVQS